MTLRSTSPVSATTLHPVVALSYRLSRRGLRSALLLAGLDASTGDLTLDHAIVGVGLVADSIGWILGCSTERFGDPVTQIKIYRCRRSFVTSSRNEAPPSGLFVPCEAAGCFSICWTSTDGLDIVVNCDQSSPDGERNSEARFMGRKNRKSRDGPSTTSCDEFVACGNCGESESRQNVAEHRPCDVINSSFLMPCLIGVRVN